MILGRAVHGTARLAIEVNRRYLTIAVCAK
jgi:hypothetical protein